MTESAPSQTLIDGKYELLRLIGRGGMGSVWEGRHVSLGTRVAVKFIDAEHANSPEARSRFDNEARAAATLQSKYAIQIHDHGMTTDGRPFIVMELLNGEALDKRLDRLGMLTLQDTANILHQACKGLQRAHDRGIIHRDLKPENIFLVTDEEGHEIVKVLDFGIAKMRTDGLSISNNTRTGAILGTPYYMSPEQARGLRDLDHRSDLWSIGVIAYRCLLGRLPFDGESVGDLLVKICTSPLPVPTDGRPDLPPAFNMWFMRALDRDPAGRYGSATELAQILCDIAGINRGARTSGMDAYHALHRAAISSDEHKTLPAVVPGGPGPAGFYGGRTPNGRPSYSGPGPISGTPLPAASATSAGLSSSTANYRPSKRSGRGLIAALATLFALVGALGALVVYLAFIRKPPEAPGFATATTRPEVTAEAEPPGTASAPLALPDATVATLLSTVPTSAKPGLRPPGPPLKPAGASSKPPLAGGTANGGATAPAKPPVVPPVHTGHPAGI